MKKRLTLFLAFVLAMGILPTASFAASTPVEAMGEVNIYNGDYALSYLSINGIIRTQNYTYFNFTTNTGQVREVPAYCVNPNTPGVPQTVGPGESIKYLANERASDPKVVGIVSNGYPHRSLAELGLENKYQAYYATKMALWCYLLPHWDINNLKVNPNLTGVELQRAQKILATAKQIYTRGVTWTTLLNPNITVETDRSAAYPVTVGGTAYLQQVFTLQSETWVCDYDISVSFSDPANVPEGTKIVDMDNREISAVTTKSTGNGYGGQFKVLYPADSVAGQTGSVQLSLSADVYKYAAMFAVCAEKDKYGTLQNYICDTDVSTHLDRSVYSNYSAEPGGSNVLPETGLIITKLETGTELPLEGAVFSITGPDGEPVGSFSSTSSGTVTIPLTLSGVYTVTEESSPQYHLLPEQRTQQVTVRYGEVAQLTFYNDPYGELSVRKISDTGETLSGVTVQIKHIESGQTYTQETGAAGVAYFEKLKPGAWEIREIAGISGWQADTGTVQTITVNAGETAETSITNKELPGLRVTKYERGAMTVLPNVAFEIFRDTESLGIFYTDQFGEILLTDCQPGTYRIEERSTGDDSHVLDTTPQEVELKAGDGIKSLVFFNDRLPGIHLIKVDSVDLSKPIANARFRFEAVDGSWGPEEYTTLEDGTIDLSKLPANTSYVVTELECPGYVVDDAQRIIHLDGNEQAQFVFTNSRMPSLHLTKTSADGTPLGGVTYRLAKIEDGSRYLDRTTSSAGIITWDGLEPSVYSLREVSTVSDHILDTKEYHVELFPGRDSTICLQNDKRPNLTVWKRDADSGVPVPDTVFLVKTADGHSVAEVVTGPDGSATVPNLLPQVYEIVEKSVPSPYLMDAPSQLVTLYPNRDRAVFFENHKRPTVTIQKENSITHDPIQYAEFHIWWASNKTDTGELRDLGTFQTNEAGQVVLEGIEEGWLKITETKSAPGYQLPENPTVEVYVKGGENKTVTIPNTPLSALVVYKRDSATGAGLANCLFQLKYLGGEVSGSGGTIIGTYQTSGNGSFTVTGLKAGYYICEELESDGTHVIDAAPQSFYISGKDQDIVTLYFSNTPKGSVILKKVDPTENSKPLEGAVFYVTDSTGAAIGPDNGLYTTGSDGLVTISDIEPGTTVIAREQQAPEGYELDESPQSVYISDDGRAHTLTFKNYPTGGLELIKVSSADRTKRLSGVTFEIRRASDDALVDTVTTGRDGRVYVLLESGSYYAVETESAKNFKLDGSPIYFTVEAGKVTSRIVTNTPLSGILIHKISSVDGKGISGVSFILYDSRHTPIDQQASDNGGYVYFENLTASGRYYLRELEHEGYIPDTELKTVYVKAGEVTEVEWENTPITGQIQLVKRSADYNPTTGLPAGTLLEGAVFEVIDRAGNVVDTIRSNSRGLAVSKPLPLSRYAIREISAPEHYCVNEAELIAYLEHEGQILRFEVTNKSLSTGVSITKTGPREVVGGQPVRYLFSGIANTSNVRLDSFYWRDTLPSAVTLEKVVTGTYNFPGVYKIVYKINGAGEYRTLADNLSTAKNYALIATPAALGLAANERVSEIMFVFGQAPGGFAQVEAPALYCTAAKGLAAGTQFTNVADVGGAYNGRWVQAVSRWVTTVYGKPTPLPRTGY